MTRLDLYTTLSHIVEEFDRLRLGVADRLTTAEEATMLSLICAIEETIEHLPLLDYTAEDEMA